MKDLREERNLNDNLLLLALMILFLALHVQLSISTAPHRLEFVAVRDPLTNLMAIERCIAKCNSWSFLAPDQYPDKS
ncbi:hypothetical protein CPB83DRAFT_863601 [Crepidotus variabilis]|uniref:Uncharacterized protein n=1 Tax=Crepidotus variabilis TaxID=179855 RepID=A0A9P6JJ82_9AGAR|nr:hypothetical protein CPB83DRAFT_863601 [Crepidotus variabilis]